MRLPKQAAVKLAVSLGVATCTIFAAPAQAIKMPGMPGIPFKKKQEQQSSEWEKGEKGVAGYNPTDAIKKEEAERAAKKQAQQEAQAAESKAVEDERPPLPGANKPDSDPAPPKLPVNNATVPGAKKSIPAPQASPDEEPETDKKAKAPEGDLEPKKAEKPKTGLLHA